MAQLVRPIAALHDRFLLAIPAAASSFVRHRHTFDWKPRPPRWQRDAYFVGEAKPDKFAWAKPLLQSGGQLATSQTPSEPHKLHVVWRLKKLNGQTKQHKEIMKLLGLDIPRHVPVVLKNTPSVNEMLLSVKHLVRVLPLNLPSGLPEDAASLGAMVLRSNGQLVLSDEAKPAAAAAIIGPPSHVCASSMTLDASTAGDASSALPTAKSSKSVWSMKGETIKQYLRKKVLDQNVAAENFKAVYTYRHNQDGKEWVYSGEPVGN